MVFLSVPLVLWFRPWHQSDSVGERSPTPSTPANHRAACTMSSPFSPQALAAAAGVNSRTRSRRAAKPVVWAAM
ncbi:MAG: hypothetical protein AW07_02391 [Candidatus Accumulibacter sp. SK-11]|nr:MAG: hypothetical protein AW07_02391 [Candidatus Accumulibacter sp. SK-11]